jgi:predicted DsbA family dithiol-disulfide isomerase
MAVESSRVTADVIEANEFPELSDRFSVSGVPKIVINDRVELLGSQREAKFVEAVLAAAGVVEGQQHPAKPD